MSDEPDPDDGSRDLAVELIAFIGREHPDTPLNVVANALLRASAASVHELAKGAQDPEVVFAKASDGWEQNLALCREALQGRRLN